MGDVTKRMTNYTTFQYIFNVNYHSFDSTCKRILDTCSLGFHLLYVSLFKT